MTKITAGPPHASRYTALDPVEQSDQDVVMKVGELIARLSPDNADLLRAFHLIQHQFGYVPIDAIPALATKIGTTPAMLYGALDFYSEIRTSPPAETVIEWCSGPACLLKGSMNMRRTLEALLGCPMGENTEDGKFGLRLVQCDGTCHLAPLLRREGKYLGPLSVSDTIALARELKGEAPPTPAAAEPSDESPGEGEG